MMRRFSKIIRNNSRNNGPDDDKQPATNGEAPQVNGTRSTANGTTEKKKRASMPFVKSKFEDASKYPQPPDHSNSRVDIEGSLNSLMSLVDHSMRPVPKGTADGTYLQDEEQHSGLFKELRTIGFKDIKTLKDQIAAGKGPIDDKTMLMERVIQLVADLPDKSIHRKELTNTFVDTLFNSLQHPPSSYLGEDFKYRKADGSNNNIQYPHIGKANTSYARTVQPEKIQQAAQPDPGLVFDALFAREKFREHPAKRSSIIFYWASLVIHDLFQTDHHDFSKSQTSSYLDLSPLYGDVQEDQDQIRTFKDGMLKPDCFCEHRLLTFPPGCGVLLIMFNRFHNYVASQLAAINENGRFTKPSPNLPPEAAEKAWAKYDNDLFQTARLVTGGLYMNITLVDYVRQIINLNASNSTWTLDPRVKESDTCFNDDGTPRGIGNQVSAEFALVYRWHSAISQKDEKWTEDLFLKMWGKPADKVSMPELLGGLSKWEAEMPDDPHQRDFNGLKRGEDGKFSDDELVDIICDSIDDVAGAFGPNHIPKVMKSIEILGMKQARSWEMCSLNEFRKFFGLKEHKTFEDFTANPKAAEQMRNLYETPDQVELYTGLIAEDAKTPIPADQGGPVGVGISPTYTISRAILSDAVALVRGDRFYTIDYTPKNLTNWGFTEVQYNFDVEQGCCFYKLFLRAFPHHMKPSSIYAHHPMTIPSEMRRIMRTLGRENDYSYDRPKRIPQRTTIQNYHGVRHVLEESGKFRIPWGMGFGYIYGEGAEKFMLSGDGPFYRKQKDNMRECLYHDQWHEHIKKFYEYITLKLLKEKTVDIAGRKQIDFSRDVGNLAHVHFASNIFNLPLKTAEWPRGVFSEHELYLVLIIQFVFIFFDVDPAKSFELALGARKVTQAYCKVVAANVKYTATTGIFGGLTDKLREVQGPLADYGVHMVRRLLDKGYTAEEATYQQICPTAAAMVGNQAQVITQTLDFYLNKPEGQKHWPDVVRTAKSDATDADDKILRYFMEAVRMHGTFGSYRTAEVKTTIDDTGFTKENGGMVDVKPGDSVFVSFVKANYDPKVFPEPDTVRLDRPMDSYIHYGVGPHACLGTRASQTALTAMLRTMAGKCENLRPAPGPQGQLKTVDKGDGFYAFMDAMWGKYFPFPTTWKLHYDNEIPEPTY